MRYRAILDERDHALAVAARLRRDGFEATLVRERLAGEDDDEDHPWAVESDAPEAMLELIVEEYDGWVDSRPSVPPPVVRPLDLPDAPKRHHRPH